jgi:hypothetical protein
MRCVPSETTKCQAIPENPLTVVQTGPTEFTAYYEDEFRPIKVRFVQGAEGEEHAVSVLPRRENQIIRVREAFGREMVPDDSQPVEDGVIFVKSIDGSPPDPMFERVMCYTFGEDPKEYHVRIHNNDTPATIREGLKKLHPGINPAEMLIQGAEVDDDWPMSDWMTRTGSSNVRVSWKMQQAYQKFWLWMPKGEVDLGDEMWSSLRIRNTKHGLGEMADYRMCTDHCEILWTEIPALHVVLVPRVMPTPSRGIEVRMMNLNGVPRPREIGPMMEVTWQLITNDHKPLGQPVEIRVPKEITLAQLVSFVVVPRVEGKFDASTVFQWCLEKDELDYAIPYTVPTGYHLKVKANTVRLGDNDKRLVELAFQDTHFHLGMRPDAMLETLNQAVVENTMARGPGDQWYVEGSPREAIDFEYCYSVLPIPAVAEIDVFIKQMKYQVKVTESWMNASDRLVAEFGLPRGILFRIFPVDVGIDRLDDEDHAYSFDWEEGM